MGLEGLMVRGADIAGEGGLIYLPLLGFVLCVLFCGCLIDIFTPHPDHTVNGPLLDKQGKEGHRHFSLNHGSSAIRSAITHYLRLIITN